MRLLLTLALVILPVGVSATAVVIFRTPTSIIIAADSRLTITDGTFRDGCKIVRSGKWWMVNGGFTRSDAVDVNATVAQAIAPTTTIEAAMQAVQQVYRAKIQPEILKAPYYQQKPPFTPVMALFIAGLEQGIPVVGRFGADAPRMDDYSATCPGRLCSDGRLRYGVGPVGFPERVRAATADVAGARRIIEEQIQVTPERVGPPIDVVELTAAGGARFSQRGACPDGSTGRPGRPLGQLLGPARPGLPGRPLGPRRGGNAVSVFLY